MTRHRQRPVPSDLLFDRLQLVFSLHHGAGLLTRAAAGESQFYIFLPLLLVLALVVIVFIVIMTNAERRITIQYAKRVVGRKQMGGQNSYLPLKLNMTGVMPIIFASALVSIPARSAASCRSTRLRIRSGTHSSVPSTIRRRFTSSSTCC